MSSAVQPFVVLSGEGETVRGPAGGPATFKARAKETNGTLTALENVIGPGEGPPLHVHVREDEMYYVIGGRVHFLAGNQRFDAPTGSFMFIPRGTPHCFRNTGTEPAHLLVVFTPSGMERFFEAMAQLPPGPPSVEAFREAGYGAWMEVVGPPLAQIDAQVDARQPGQSSS